MPPKGWKKNAQPAVTGAKSPEPQPKPEKIKKAVARMPRAAKSEAAPVEKISSQYGTPGGTEVAYSLTIGDKMRLLLQELAAVTQAANTQNLSADAYSAINEEIVATVDALGDLRDALVPAVKMAVGQPEISLEPIAEVTQPKPPKQAAAPAQQVSPPPPPMPFPAPGIQQGPLPGFVPVASR